MVDTAPRPGSPMAEPDPHPEQHRAGEAEWLEEAIFGSLDGVITSLALVVTVASVLRQDHQIVFLTVIAGAVAGTLSMFVGAFLSSRSREHLIRKERAMEEWEVEHIPEVEKKECEAIYRAHGYTDEEVEILVRGLMRDKKRWVDMMMRDELGLEPYPPQTSFRHATVIGVSYLIGGAIPAIPFLFAGATAGNFLGYPVPTTLLASLGLGGVILGSVGVVDSQFSGRGRLRSMVDLLAIGFATAIAVFLVTTALSPVLSTA